MSNPTFMSQEEEHYAHEWNSQSESQNCLDEAKMGIHNGDYACQAREAASAGKVAAVVSHPVYCRSTDAFAGMQDCDVFIGDTQDEVEALIAEAHPHAYEEELSFKWYGLPVPVLEPVEVAVGEDCPF